MAVRRRRFPGGEGDEMAQRYASHAQLGSYDEFAPDLLGSAARPTGGRREGSGCLAVSRAMGERAAPPPLWNGDGGSPSVSMVLDAWRNPGTQIQFYQAKPPRGLFMLESAPTRLGGAPGSSVAIGLAWGERLVWA
jgi:hypothetical protein